MDSLVSLIIFLPGILLALTVHEFSHALVADRLGDPTPRSTGRLTLNPIPHIDPIGFILLFLIHIGWAKPVPVNPYYFRDPEKDFAKVALAGPLSNLILAVFISFILKFFPDTSQNLFIYFFYKILLSTYIINLILAFFNLIPIPPLDGSRILSIFLPFEWKLRYRILEPYGVLILTSLIVFSSLLGIPLIESFVFLPARLVSFLLMGSSPL
ncbi:MAG: site-2 protease family protein [Candidatus Hydrothermales bacterium]